MELLHKAFIPQVYMSPIHDSRWDTSIAQAMVRAMHTYGCSGLPMANTSLTVRWQRAHCSEWNDSERGKWEKFLWGMLRLFVRWPTKKARSSNMLTKGSTVKASWLSFFCFSTRKEPRNNIWLLKPYYRPPKTTSIALCLAAYLKESSALSLHLKKNTKESTTLPPYIPQRGLVPMCLS